MSLPQTLETGMVAQNPFNVLGLLAGVGEKELTQRRSRINAFLSVGKELVFPEDIPSAANGRRRDRNTIDEALAAIDRPVERAIHGLYWFVDSGRADGPALAHLRGGDEEKAGAIWQKVVEAGPLTLQTISSCSNLGSLALLRGATSPPKLLHGIRWKAQAFSSEHFVELVKTLSNELVAKNPDAVIAQWAERLCAELMPRFKDQANFMAELGQAIRSAGQPGVRRLLLKPFEDHFVKQIEQAVADCRKKRNAAKANADVPGLTLAKEIGAPLMAYRGLVGEQDMGYTHAADEVAEEMLQCSIDHFNERIEQGTVRTDALRKLMKEVQALACGHGLKARVKENNEVLERRLNELALKPVIDQVIGMTKEMSATTASINSVISNCSSPLSRLEHEDRSVHLEISSIVVNQVLNKLIDLINTVQKSIPKPRTSAFKELLSTLEEATGIMDRLKEMRANFDVMERLRANRRTFDSIHEQLKLVNQNAPETIEERLTGCAWMIGFILLIGLIIETCN